MILSLKDNHKANLLILLSQPVQVLQDFCKLARDYLTKGPNHKLYLSAAQKLNLETEVFQNAVEGLINLLMECCKHQLSSLDLRDTIITLGFNEEQCEVLQMFYNSCREELLEVLARQIVDLPQYKDLEWRLEAQVASRALLEQMTPQVTMRLSLENSTGTDHILLQSDPSTLLHITEALEAALSEANSHFFRKIQRRLM